MAVQQRRARERENLRQEILNAARTLFLKNGFENVSVRKIADQIEYSPGTIYLYFRDKADIFNTLCEETFSKLARRLKAIADDSCDPIEKLRRAGRAYVDFALHYPHHYQITFIAGHKEKGIKPEDARIQTAGVNCFNQMRLIVQQCREADQLQGEDIDEISQALWAAVHGVSTLLITQCGFPFIERSRLIERVVDMAVEGVRKKSG